MNPLLETAAVVLIASGTVLLGVKLSGCRKPLWLIGYAVSAVLTAVLVTNRFTDSLAFTAPFCFIVTGRAKFIMLAVAATAGPAATISRLPHKFERVTICLLMGVVVIWFSVMPFLCPALIRNELSNLTTKVNSEGICFQTRSYTCGPAAAVTALTKLGLMAEEGEMAILSHSSPVAGTLPASLCAAIRNRYADKGIECRYRRFDSVDQLQWPAVTLAVVKDSLMLDHCVAVLEVSEKAIVIGDPVMGRIRMSRDSFEKIWRFRGITLEKNTAEHI